MNQPPRIEYRNPMETPAKSGWATVRRVALGLMMGVGIGIAVIWLVSLLFPTPSRAAVGQQAGYIVCAGLVSGVAGLTGFGFKRWLLAGALLGAGGTMTLVGFAVGLMSSIVC